MSKPPKVASRPAGDLRGAVSPQRGTSGAKKKYVSKWTHGFYITINSRPYDPIFQIHHTH